ncbi:MAG: fumarylacetoacetate hydrolase family protein [Gammaproteobacteria bacterium]|nr:fumarylacetoacetate hydrolase family protein [Gammaproteobacteria bacterium]
MKLVRYGRPGAERPGLIDAQGAVRDLSPLIGDVDGSSLSGASLARLRALDVATLKRVDSVDRLGSCVVRPGKFICIGLNFRDHAAETGASIPAEPVVFLKATSAVSGPNDPIIMPRNSRKLDWEVELAFVVGEECRYVDESDAAAKIAGYCVCHDVSEREFQLERGGQWDKGKGCDSFGPIGPWLVTADEVRNPDSLRLWLTVNGERMQDGSTSQMIFRPAFLLSYLSQFMSLQPGDVVTTGTPAGVGLGRKPPRYLQVGDVVELGIEGLGTQRQVVVPWNEGQRT